MSSGFVTAGLLAPPAPPMRIRPRGNLSQSPELTGSSSIPSPFSSLKCHDWGRLAEAIRHASDVTRVVIRWQPSIERQRSLAPSPLTIPPSKQQQGPCSTYQIGRRDTPRLLLGQYDSLSARRVSASASLDGEGRRGSPRVYLAWEQSRYSA